MRQVEEPTPISMTVPKSATFLMEFEPLRSKQPKLPSGPIPASVMTSFAQPTYSTLSSHSRLEDKRMLGKSPVLEQEADSDVAVGDVARDEMEEAMAEVKAVAVEVVVDADVDVAVLDVVEDADADAVVEEMSLSLIATTPAKNLIRSAMMAVMKYTDCGKKEMNDVESLPLLLAMTLTLLFNSNIPLMLLLMRLRRLLIVKLQEYLSRRTLLLQHTNRIERTMP